MMPDNSGGVNRFSLAVLPINWALILRSCKEDLGFPSFPCGTRLAPSEIQDEFSSAGAVVADSEGNAGAPCIQKRQINGRLSSERKFTRSR